jgi:serine/threonine-protein kinase
VNSSEDLLERNQRRVGTVVRRKYRLDALLGVGGMGAVFAATHRNGGRMALKVLHPELAKLDDLRNRFLREGYVANLVNHPGIVRILDDDDDDDHGTVFLVMELLVGETLDARWQRFFGRMPPEEVVAWADRVLDVLAVAHAHGVVHRDIKPENLFVTTQGELKVLDFGIARLLDGTSATRTGAVLGTPAYMPPEQASGEPKSVDARSDLWSLGAVMFALLTGSPVHAAKTPSEQMIYAATQGARAIESIAPWVPAALASVVNRALAFEKGKRWATAGEMRERIRGTASGAIATRVDALSATMDDPGLTVAPIKR